MELCNMTKENPWTAEDHPLYLCIPNLIEGGGGAYSRINKGDGALHVHV